MFSSPIVIDFNVPEEVSLKRLNRVVPSVVCQLCFQGMKERLCNSVVPAVAFTAHALNSTELFQLQTEIFTRILNSAIRMDHQPFLGTPVPQALPKAFITETRSNDLLTSHPTIIRE